MTVLRFKHKPVSISDNKRCACYILYCTNTPLTIIMEQDFQYSIWDEYHANPNVVTRRLARMLTVSTCQSATSVGNKTRCIATRRLHGNKVSKWLMPGLEQANGKILLLLFDAFCNCVVLVDWNWAAFSSDDRRIMLINVKQDSLDNLGKGQKQVHSETLLLWDVPSVSNLGTSRSLQLFAALQKVSAALVKGQRAVTHTRQRRRSVTSAVHKPPFINSAALLTVFLRRTMHCWFNNAQN